MHRRIVFTLSFIFLDCHHTQEDKTTFLHQNNLIPPHKQSAAKLFAVQKLLKQSNLKINNDNLN